MRAQRVPTVHLNDGVEIPAIGLGTARVLDADTEPMVLDALEVGYRSIDTAKDYGNERGVGRALARCGIPRGELFVTTKVWNADQGETLPAAALQRSLDRLGLDYVDLYLIHWPVPSRNLYVPTWRALEELKESGLVRSIGVSNFERAHIRALLAEGLSIPSVNQIELHPKLQQHELRAFHADLGIVTEAESPLAKSQMLTDPVVNELARARGVSPAQLTLCWHLQVGAVPVPKTTSKARMAENLAAMDLPPLTPAEMAAIAGLDGALRVGPHPSEFADLNPLDWEERQALAAAQSSASASVPGRQAESPASREQTAE